MPPEAIAVRRRAGTAPTVVFLPGYASDMAGTKALALDGWAARTGRGFVRFDYRGCGESTGAFEDFTIDDWRDDALAVIDATQGPIVLVGSSMGVWIALLVALARTDRVVAVVGIAAAPDFTDWGFDGADRATLASTGRIEQPSAYGPPLITTQTFVLAGQRNLLLGSEIAIACPVRLIHGQRDADVPWHHSLTLADRLRSRDVQAIFVKDGDHRLSRPGDIALIIGMIESLPC